MKRLLMFLLLSGPLPAHAQEIYKVVDEQGRVVYTSVKPDNMKDVGVIAAPPTPSDEEIGAAKQQLETYHKQRQEREQAQAQAPVTSTHRVERYVEKQYVPVPVSPVRPLRPVKPVRPVRPIERPIQLPARPR